MRTRISKALTYWVYFLAWRILGYLPEKSLYQLGNRMAPLFLSKSRRLRSNLQVIVGEPSDIELDELHRAGMRSYIRYWLDTFRFSRWSREKILSTVELSNEHLLRDELAKGGTAFVNRDRNISGAPVFPYAMCGMFRDGW